MNWNHRSTSANDTENKTNREKTVKRNTHTAQILALNFECKIGHFLIQIRVTASVVRPWMR